MANNRSQTNEKIERVTKTAERFAHQMGGTFVEVKQKRADFETRENSHFVKNYR